MIGINQLTGEEEKLEKPLTLGKVVKGSPGESGHIVIHGEITRKIVFKHRPVPIMARTKVKTA